MFLIPGNTYKQKFATVNAQDYRITPLASLKPGKELHNIEVCGRIVDINLWPFRCSADYQDYAMAMAFTIKDFLADIEQKVVLFAPESAMLPKFRVLDEIVVKDASFVYIERFGNAVYAYSNSHTNIPWSVLAFSAFKLTKNKALLNGLLVELPTFHEESIYMHNRDVERTMEKARHSAAPVGSMHHLSIGQ
ncbi:hypothetical protein BGZ58_007347 [Dissophora ornata]|nr:hypothetical protein BGZ58_007347 [Dissophora ornata]